LRTVAACCALGGVRSGVNPLIAKWIEVALFGVEKQGTKEPSAYEVALDFYVGDLLPEDRYEGWAEERRRELRPTCMFLLAELASIHEGRGEYGSAAEALRRVVSEEPARGEARAGLMRLERRFGGSACRRHV
jgi:two-component SAPR family response regulator